MENKPQIIASGPLAPEVLEQFVTEYGVNRVVDIYEQQFKDLEAIHYTGDAEETWIYFPWADTVLHCVGHEALFALRTNRNKLLITEDEQQKLRQSVVGVAGMSVGSGIALGLAYSGVSDVIKIADKDTLDTSNLNRLRESLLSVGTAKVSLAARHIYELNPFADVITFDDGVTDDTIDQFFTGPNLSVVIDEIDDFKMKVALRLKAKQYGVPLLMFTSLGDNILVDIERYDLDADLQPFHGLIGDTVEEIVSGGDLSLDDIRKYAVKLVGMEYVPTRALLSLTEMGKSLSGRPQLYSTIAVDGGLAAYVVRQIILNNEPVSGRYFVKFAELFGMVGTDLAKTDDRVGIIKKLMS